MKLCSKIEKSAEIDERVFSDARASSTGNAIAIPGAGGIDAQDWAQYGVCTMLD
jgi:hypothetical protein